MKRVMTNDEMVVAYKKIQLQRREYSKKYNWKLRELAKLGQKYLDEKKATSK